MSKIIGPVPTDPPGEMTLCREGDHVMIRRVWSGPVQTDLPDGTVVLRVAVEDLRELLDAE